MENSALFWITVIALIVGIGVVRKLLRIIGRRSAKEVYVRGGPLLTKGEARFFAELQGAVRDRYYVALKVRMADVLTCKIPRNSPDFFRAFAKISQKHCDFVLCDPATFLVCGVIELDDSSHARADRRERDVFFNRAMAEAGVPVVRMPISQAYRHDEIRRLIHESGVVIPRTRNSNTEN